MHSWTKRIVALAGAATIALVGTTAAGASPRKGPQSWIWCGGAWFEKVGEARVIPAEVHINRRVNYPVTFHFVVGPTRFAQPQATRGVDFQVPDTITIPPRATKAFVPITILPDNEREPIERFDLRIASVDAGVLMPYWQGNTIAIVDAADTNVRAN